MRFVQTMLIVMLIVVSMGLLAESDPQTCDNAAIATCIKSTTLKGADQKSAHQNCRDGTAAHRCLMNIKPECTKDMMNTFHRYNTIMENVMDMYCQRPKTGNTPHACTQSDIAECIMATTQKGPKQKSVQQNCKEATNAHSCLLNLKSQCPKDMLSTFNRYNLVMEESMDIYCEERRIGKDAETCTTNGVTDCLTSMTKDTNAKSAAQNCIDGKYGQFCLLSLQSKCSGNIVNSIISNKAKMDQLVRTYCPAQGATLDYGNSMIKCVGEFLTNPDYFKKIVSCAENYFSESRGGTASTVQNCEAYFSFFNCLSRQVARKCGQFLQRPAFRELMAVLSEVNPQVASEERCVNALKY